MDTRYYEILRESTQDDFYNAINDPEDELYDIVWDLFERLVIEPAEIFEIEFRERNQFRYSIDSGALLEFFPDSTYFKKRPGPNPFEDDSDAAGVHLQFLLFPMKSCLFAVGFQIWGPNEVEAFRLLWGKHRKRFSMVLRRCKPMLSWKSLPPELDYSSSVEEVLDNYFRTPEPEGFLSFQYPFAQFQDVEQARKFMIPMALFYQTLRTHCQSGEDTVEESFEEMLRHFRGRIPDLEDPLPCVDLGIVTDAD